MSTRTKKNDGPLRVRVHLDVQGAIYALEPLSRLRVKERFPEARGLPSVFFGYDTEEEFVERHQPYWELAATLLTGVSMEQIAELGGLCFYQPLTDRVFWEWIPDRKALSGKETPVRSR